MSGSGPKRLTVLYDGAGGEVDVSLVPSDGAIVDEVTTQRFIGGRRQDDETFVGESGASVERAGAPLKTIAIETEDCRRLNDHIGSVCDDTGRGALETAGNCVRTAVET